MKIARALNRTIVGARRLAGLGNSVCVRRNGVLWELDLNEGIDLAIYLGLYQTIPQRVTDRWIRPGALAFDVGANVGAFCLPLLGSVGSEGCVIAVEPTDYAFSKLKINTGLNPALAQRLIAVQAALNDGRSGDGSTTTFFSRWPLDAGSGDRHAEHMGKAESASRARFLSLDSLLGELRAAGRVRRALAFVKVDVDGHEADVLAGAGRTFSADRPALLIEIAPYVQDEVSGRFERLIGLLDQYGYALEDAASGAALPLSAAGLRGVIKLGASIDALARPK